MKSTGEAAKNALDRYLPRGLLQNSGTLAVARVTCPAIVSWISTSSWCSEPVANLTAPSVSALCEMSGPPGDERAAGSCLRCY